MSNAGKALDGLLRDWLEAAVYDELVRTLGEIPGLLERHSYNFRHNLFPSLSDLDRRIPGVGLYNVLWYGGLPRMPLARAFEAVTRPLGQVVRSLSVSDSPQRLASYEIAFASVSHLEQCVKLVPDALPRKSLGALVKQRQVKECLGSTLAGAIRKYALFGNEAKHVMAKGQEQTSPISFDEALRGYFIVRALGAAVLGKIGVIEDLEALTENAAQLERFDADRDITGSSGYMRQAGPSGRATFRPTDVRALPEFCDWLDALWLPKRIAVIAAIERLAAYGDELAGPHVVPWGSRLFALKPERPAQMLSIVFVRLWGEQAVLLMGVDDWQMEKRVKKHLRLAWRRYRQALRQNRDTVRFADFVGPVDDQTRAEIEAAKVYMAAISVMVQEREIRQVRNAIQLDLDFLNRQPIEEPDTEPGGADSSSWYHRSAVASLQLGPDILEHLPRLERIPLVPVRELPPPEKWKLMDVNRSSP